MWEAGIFADIFKIGHVCCIYKRSGLKSDKSSWRPVTLLPSLSKCAEAVMHRRLLSHFIENNIISERQAAYLKGDSTIQQILYIIHLIRTTWSKKQIMQGVYLDVSAAFDKAWHKAIIAKLEQIQVKGTALDVFRSYLENRKQIVVIGECKSDIKDVQAGIPQGSRLGPLLWLLYINDIVEDLESETLLFADDTCLFASGPDPTITTEILNRDLQKISVWASKWKVLFNPGKSKDMIFSDKLLANSFPVMFNNIEVQRVFQHKHLGIWLSSTLSWQKQIHELCVRANAKLAVLRSVKYLSRSTLDILYKLQIRSLIDYGLVTYYHQLKQTEVARLDQIQYKAAKLASGALHFTSKVKLNLEMGWEEISSRAEYLGLCLFQKIHLNLTRPLVKKCMPQYIVNFNNTRSGNGYRLFPAANLKFTQSFFPHFTKVWKKLPNSLKNERDLVVFKEKLKEKIKPKKYFHFKFGSKRGNALLTQLRVGRSFLNSHSFVLGMEDLPYCDICYVEENTCHYMLTCDFFKEQRDVLFKTVSELIPNFITFTMKRKLDLLLYGINRNLNIRDCRNVPLTLAVQKYILSTNRF